MKHLKVGIAGLLLSAASALSFADTSVDWVSPTYGTAYDSGTTVTIQGQAGASGQIGTGMDLVLVLDSSGSMSGRKCSASKCQSLQQWQRDAAIAMVNSLPNGTTSVGVVEFDHSTNTVKQLIGLTDDRSELIKAINDVNAAGLTNIGLGIDEATAELTSARHTAGRAQHMVVFSDGYTSGNPATNASRAVAQGVESVHSVALPGSNISTMTSIASNGQGTLVDARNNLDGLVDLFAGQGGSLVALDHVDVILDDGTVISDVATDAFGNFSVDVEIVSGENTFVANAFGTDGTGDSATLVLYGNDPSAVPEPGTISLIGLGLLVLGLRRRMV